MSPFESPFAKEGSCGECSVWRLGDFRKRSSLLAFFKAAGSRFHFIRPAGRSSGETALKERP